jgi:hypothetical protein
MYIFDEEGNAVENLIIRVRSNEGMLTLQKGAQRVTYNCMTNCDSTLTVGDSVAAFGEVNTQLQMKAQQAASSPQTGN